MKNSTLASICLNKFHSCAAGFTYTNNALSCLCILILSVAGCMTETKQKPRHVLSSKTNRYSGYGTAMEQHKCTTVSWPYMNKQNEKRHKLFCCGNMQNLHPIESRVYKQRV